MEEVPEIHIELRLIDSNRFPANFIVAAIETVDRAIGRAENEEIEELSGAFPEIPAAIFDAIRFRAQRLSYQSLNFEAASTGSIVLLGVASAVAYWLLDKTLGETAKQAWSESDLHLRIKEFLHRRLREKVKRIDGNIQRHSPTGASVETNIETLSQRGVVLIIVTMSLPRELAPVPTVREIDAARANPQLPSDELDS